MTSTPTSSRIPTSKSFTNQQPAMPSNISAHSLNKSTSNGQLATSVSYNALSSSVKNYYISIYPYVSSEAGDLNFREFEIINVVATNEDWLTGQVIGSGSDASNPLRSGIFPANYVIKFNFPIEYIGKYTISMASAPYQAQNNGELSVNPAESQLIAIKKISPDSKWSYGETHVIYFWIDLYF